MHALQIFVGETLSWWQVPLAFSQLIDPDVDVQKGSTAHWVAMAEGAVVQPTGWDVHGVLTTFLPAVKELPCSYTYPAAVPCSQSLCSICARLLHVPVTNASSDKVLKERLHAERCRSIQKLMSGCDDPDELPIGGVQWIEQKTGSRMEEHAKGAFLYAE